MLKGVVPPNTNKTYRRVRESGAIPMVYIRPWPLIVCRQPCSQEVSVAT